LIEQAFDRRGSAMPYASASIHVAQPDLLRGGSELVDLSMLAARASAAARRLSAGGTLDVEDRTIMETLASVLEAAARSVEFFGSEGRSGSPASGALAARIDAAIDAVLHEDGRPTAGPNLVAELYTLGSRVRELSNESVTVDEAVKLGEFFADLAASVLRQSGNVGEVTATL
jgi:hypothetical protein